MTEFRIVLVTAPSHEEALQLAKGLVENRLAACVNIIPNITSVYRWQGEIQADSECLLIAKTDHRLWDDLVAWVQNHHSYTVPEIIQLPIQEGASSYLQWILECVGK